MERIENLVEFGLTRQEANIYLLLTTEGELTGYEVAKHTGISRSNTYNALAGLVDKGAAYVIEGSAVKYSPVNIDEFCSNKIRYLSNIYNTLKNSMPSRRVETNGYITIKGEKHIYDKMTNMLLDAKERVYLSVENNVLVKFDTELKNLINNNIKVVLITNEPYKCNGAVLYYAQKKAKQIRLIVDSKHVLTGSVADKEYATCLYSNNNNLVDVFKEALKNEIQLIEIRKEE